MPVLKRAATLTALAVVATCPASAGAAERWSVKGAGWGHGIGMSQWGAYGYAKQGTGYRDILGHYYRKTQIGSVPDGAVRVLLQPNRSTVYFRHATQAGDRELNEGSGYRATREGGNVVLRSSSGRRLGTYPDVLRVVGGKHVRLMGRADNGVRDGLYRDHIEIRTAAGSGLNAINAVDLEDYLLGVVPGESPSSWPAAALQAQAVAARSYAIASNVNGKGFDQYADTRSQVYRGYLAETASTNAAVAATAGEVVTYGGEVATTFFFSTSGGHTENVENVFTGGSPKPWLKGVKDPYDKPSPYHRWGPFTYSRSVMASKLGSWVKGRLKRFRVVKRGVSPRVVKARIEGTRGRTTVTGPQIRTRLGLRDTWFYVRRVRTKRATGAEARTLRGARPVVALHGTVDGAQLDSVTLERKTGDRWKRVGAFPVETGAYRIHVGTAGIYRVKAGWAAGPALRVAPPLVG
jgi:stage II sporulation protein D